MGVVSILAGLPWAKIIAAAPDVAQGAQALLRAVGRSKRDIPVKTPAAPARGPVDAQTLGDTVRRLEASLLTLNDQLAQASRMIADLADSNIALLAAAERQRRRLIALAVVALAALLLAGWAALR